MSRRFWLPVEGSCSCPGSVGYQLKDPAHVQVVLVTSRRILLMSGKCWQPEGGSCSCMEDPGHI
jgi:hypothetical protein